jgi:MFS family permease
VVHQRDFLLLWTGQTTSALGDAFMILVLPFAALQLSGRPSAVGLVLAAYAIPFCVFVLLGGVWSDRLSRRRVMLVSDVVRGSVQATTAVLFFSGAASLASLIVLTAAYAAASAFFQPAALGVVPQVVGRDALQQANGLLGVSRELAFVAGQPLAGVLVAVGSPAAAFATDAGTFAVSAATLALLRLAPSTVALGTSFLADLRHGLAVLRARTWALAVMAWSWTHLLVVVAPLYVLGPVVASHSLGGAASWGLITGSFSAGAVAGSLVAVRWRPRRPLAATAWLQFPAALGPLLVALTAPTAAIAAAQLCSGLSSGFFTAVWTTTLQERLPDEARSRVLGFNALGTSAAMTVGYALTPLVAARIGITATLEAASVWVVVSAAAILAVPGVRGLPRRLPAAGQELSVGS